MVMNAAAHMVTGCGKFEHIVMSYIGLQCASANTDQDCIHCF